MTDSSDTLACKFTLQIEQSHGRYVVEIPATEVEHGTLTAGEPCQITVHTIDGQPQSGSVETESQVPVSVGEQRRVEIEDTGEQGDGITQVERGYVLIVTGGTPGNNVTVEIENVFPNYAFASIIEEHTTTSPE